MVEIDKLDKALTISEHIAKTENAHAELMAKQTDLWKCGVCGETDKEKLHLCRYHHKVFCKSCLGATTKLGNSTFFIAKCPGKPRECTYEKITPKDPFNA